MSRRGTVWTGLALLLALGVGGLFAIGQLRDSGTEVRVEEVIRRDLAETVTASGSLRARRTVNVSADVMGRVVELRVREGDEVEAGEVLLRLDPTQHRASLARARAGLARAEAQAEQQRAALSRAEGEHRRVTTLRQRDSTLVSLRQMEEVETEVAVARARAAAAVHTVEEARGSVEEAEDRLERITIRAPLSGRVTRLEVEEGETVVVGTTGTPGSRILTLGDLSGMEVVLEVDETDIPRIQIGDTARVGVDAHPDRTFRARVTEISSSAIRGPASLPGGAGEGRGTSVDFQVVLALDNPEVSLLPDLSVTAEIVTGVRPSALAIPIVALTVRPRGVPPAQAEDDALPSRTREPAPRAGLRGPREEEGVFVVRDWVVQFTPVEVGITGEEHFEVVSGLQEGDTVVAGPYQRVRELRDGDRVRPLREEGP